MLLILLILGKTSMEVGSDMENVLELADKNLKTTILKGFENLRIGTTSE